MSVFCDMQWLEFCRGGLWALGWFFCYVCLQGGFWLKIHASFCHGSKASVFPSNCWELGWRDLICHCWSKRLKCHQNEIKSDQIELELCLHTLLPFSSSLPVLFSLVLIPPPPFIFPPLLHFSPSCGTDCSSPAEMIYWCQAVNLLSRICTCPVVCRGSAIPLHALSRKHKWIIYGALGSAENPLMWSKCHACSHLRFFSPFLVVVLKVSFDRTLVAELTPETLLKTTAFPLRARSWRLCFSLAFHRIF